MSHSHSPDPTHISARPPEGPQPPTAPAPQPLTDERDGKARPGAHGRRANGGARLRRWLLAILLPPLFAAHAAPLPADAPCYPADIPAPPLRAQTLILIDRTAWPDAVARRDFIDAAQTLVAQGGQRLVILSFAGLATGEALAREVDLRIDAPLTDAETINNSRIGPYKRSQACVAQRQQQALTRSRQTLERLLVAPDPGLTRSEIAWALARTLHDFAGSGLPTRLLVYSDGLQHGSGQSFYQPARAGESPLSRRIDPDDELRKLPASLPGPANAASARAKEAIRVWWWGLLLAEPRAAAARQLDSELLARYERYWRAAVQRWRGELVAIGQTLNNPDFALPTTAQNRP